MLRIFVDRYLVEVFVNDRQAVIASHRSSVNRPTLNAFTVGAPTTLKQVELWKIRPTNQGFQEARTNRVWLPQVNESRHEPSAHRCAVRNPSSESFSERVERERKKARSSAVCPG